MVCEESVLEHRSDGTVVILVCVGVDRYAYVDRPIIGSLVRLFLDHLSFFRTDSTGFELTSAGGVSRSTNPRSVWCFRFGRVEWIALCREVAITCRRPFGAVEVGPVGLRNP